MKHKYTRRQTTFPSPLIALATVLALLFLAPPACAKSLPELKIDESPLADDPGIPSLAPIVAKASPSVVNIYTAKTVRERPAYSPFFDDPFFREFFGIPYDRVPRERREQALGSGVIVSADGYILTNNHVVDGADEIRIVLPETNENFDAEIVGTDPKTDIAVLKVDADKPLPAITIANSDTLRVGDYVIAIGNPLGVGQTVTSGIVSALGRGGIGLVDYEDFIQTDASINPGNSGGALVDMKGRLVGINTAILSRSGGSQGIGFAVPSNLARSVMESIIEYGEVRRGYLGVLIQPVTPELAEEFGLEENHGALIGDVTPGSPADKAGLEPGDVVLAFNGQKVHDSRQLQILVAQSRPGTTAELTIIRDGREKTIEVELGELDGGGLARADGRSGLRRDSGRDPLDGITVDDLDYRTRRQFGIPRQVTGALVVDVDPNSPAAAAGLRPGDVIVEINRQPVEDADHAVRLSERIEGSRVLLRVWSNGMSRYLVIDANR
ncbi:MAG: DegQ family serine endoprotease [Verrucomicrobia bacterium]|nr:MAG: DegQ family serine endoprotease [Verrucomicrobiota bacterium]